MKSATIPPVRIDPAFREAMEASLQAGETLASLVETAVRAEVHRRREQSEFVRRGIAAIESTAVAGNGIPATAVLTGLEEKLQAARQRTSKNA